MLERLTRKARTAWTVVALIALAVSLTGPLSGVTAGASAALACLHLAVAAVLIPGLRRSSARR